MAYTTIDDPSEYFQTIIYTGNGSARSLTFSGNADMQPDMFWSKKRADAAQNHCVTDSQRGVGNIIFPDAADQESATQLVTSFDSDGFTLGTQQNVNASANNDNSFVSWSCDNTPVA